MNKNTKQIKLKTGKLFIFSIIIIAVICGLRIYSEYNIPDKYYIFEKDTNNFESMFNSVKFSPVTSTVTIEDDNYSVDFKLLGILPIKKSKIEIVDEKSLMAGGNTFGIKLYTDGVLVISLTDIETDDGKTNPAHESGLKIKDVIMTVDGTKITGSEHLTECVKQCGGKALTLGVKRDKIYFEVKVTPVKDRTGIYRLGCWVRDSTAGIGTITFYDVVNKTFAGLGHGICDSDTGELMTLSYGKALHAEIFSVIKGTSGTPGELRGTFDESKRIGTLYKNCDTGIFGTIETSYNPDGEIYPIAFKQDIHEGNAQILCTIDENGVRSYDIEIVHIYTNATKSSKNMVISVTDENLIEKTGGIVQGMSGSPIIQDGKIIGAVTHVMINDPTKGYGIFIENMLNELGAEN